MKPVRILLLVFLLLGTIAAWKRTGTDVPVQCRFGICKRILERRRHFFDRLRLPFSTTIRSLLRSIMSTWACRIPILSTAAFTPMWTACLSPISHVRVLRLRESEWRWDWEPMQFRRDRAGVYMPLSVWSMMFCTLTAKVTITPARCLFRLISDPLMSPVRPI